MALQILDLYTEIKLVVALLCIYAAFIDMPVVLLCAKRRQTHILNGFSTKNGTAFYTFEQHLKNGEILIELDK